MATTVTTPFSAARVDLHEYKKQNIALTKKHPWSKLKLIENVHESEFKEYWYIKVGSDIEHLNDIVTQTQIFNKNILKKKFPEEFI